MSGNVPVFVFPSTLSFYVSDVSSQKQILTIYNPYDFPLSYRVLCTAPKKYSVVDPEGTLKSKCCIDIVIRHLAARNTNIGQIDRFRIKIHEHGQRECLGNKDVIASLEYSAGSEEPSSDIFEGISQRPSTTESSRQYTFPERTRGQAPPQGEERVGGPTSAVVVFVGVCCIVVLSLPTLGDTSTVSSVSYPPYLYLTVPQKLVASYVLGLITMLLLRP